MSYLVRQHLPLITNRIEFQFATLPPLPPITLRQNLERKVRRQIGRNKTPYTRTRPRECTPSDDSDLSDLPSETDDDPLVDTVSKIPKPPGEAGRKNCGGFNLEKELGLGQAKYDELMKSVNNEVTGRLDAKKSFSKQKPVVIREVIQAITEQLEISDKYENDWPVREALKMRLKYKSETARRQAQRKADKTLKKVILEGARPHDDEDI